MKNEQTVAWAWVLENASLIEGIVKKLSNGSVLDFEDLRSDVLVRLV